MSKKLLSAFLTITFLFCSTIGICIVNGSALGMLYNTSKISPELKDCCNEKLTVYIWFEDEIDMAKIEEKAEKAVGFAQESLEKMEKEYCEFKGEIYKNNEYTEDYLSFIKETKAIRREILEKQNILIQKQRDLTKEYYENYNKEMLYSVGIDEKQIVYSSLFSPVVVITTSNAEIEKLSKNENIEYIGYKDNSAPEEDFSSALPAVDAIYVRDT